MQDYKEQLKEQLKQLKELRRKLNRHIKKFGDVPQGKVKVLAPRGHSQYYLKKPGEKSYSYVKVEELEDVKKIIQYDYYKAMQKRLEEQYKALESFLRRYDIEKLDRLYTDLTDGRRKYIEPIIKPDEEYIEYWYKQFGGKENGFREDLIFKTERGEMVRSKSEKIIADMLLNRGIPYVYEPCIRLDNGREVFPDFAALNVRKRKTVLWEHLGRLGDEYYARKNSLKILDYEREGCIEGDTLITTKESDKKPLDVEQVEKKIRLFLM